MRCCRLHIFLIVLLLPLLSWSINSVKPNKRIQRLSVLEKKQNLKVFPYQSSVSTLGFSHRTYMGVGANSFIVDYNAHLKLKNWAEIGLGLGINSNRVKFYSASDLHIIRLTSLPTYLTATIYPYHDENRAFYIKGNYGFANSVSGKKNNNDNSLQGNVMQAAIGYKHFSYSMERFWFIELSQYSTIAKGTFNDAETYKASIDYNLEFYAVVLSVGVNLNRH